MSEPTCSTCPVGRRERGDLVICKQSPHPRRRKASDWCGQHPGRQRDRIAARVLAALVARGERLTDPNACAVLAYDLTDALLAAGARPAGADVAEISEARCA